MVHEHVPSTGCAVCDAGVHAGEDELAAAGEALAREGIRRRAFLGGAAGAAVAFGAQALLPRAAVARRARPHAASGPHADPRAELGPDLREQRPAAAARSLGGRAERADRGRRERAHPRARRTAGAARRAADPGHDLRAHARRPRLAHARADRERPGRSRSPACAPWTSTTTTSTPLTAYNLAEILRGGCTTHLEQSLDLRQAKSYVRVARRWGVRGYPAPMLPNFARVVTIRARTTDQVLFDSVPDQLAEIEASLRWGRTVNGAEGGRIRPQMAPQGPETATPETLRAIAAAARELGNGIHTHLATGARVGARGAAVGQGAGEVDRGFRVLRRAAVRRAHERLGRDRRRAVPGRQAEVPRSRTAPPAAAPAAAAGRSSRRWPRASTPTSAWTHTPTTCSRTPSSRSSTAACGTR